jgi:hypothetical protein
MIQRICARCGHLGAFPYDGVGADEVEVRECEGCGFETRQRPLCDDWDGSWALPGEDEEPSDPAGSVGAEADRTDTGSSSSTAPAVAGTFSAEEQPVDGGPWCPTCESDLEDEGKLAGTQAWYCPSCESLLPDDDALHPGDTYDDLADRDDGAGRDDDEGNQHLTDSGAGDGQAAVATDGGEAEGLGRWT